MDALAIGQRKSHAAIGAVIGMLKGRPNIAMIFQATGEPSSALLAPGTGAGCVFRRRRWSLLSEEKRHALPAARSVEALKLAVIGAFEPVQDRSGGSKDPGILPSDQPRRP